MQLSKYNSKRKLSSVLRKIAETVDSPEIKQIGERLSKTIKHIANSIVIYCN